jgi:heat shock protein HslJ
MKHLLAALIFPLILAGCAGSSDKTATNSPARMDNAILMQHSWLLDDARDKGEMRIIPLFVQPEKPVQLKFNGKRFNLNNSCNNMIGKYSLHGKGIIFDTIVSTRKMCTDSKMNALDNEIASRLKEANTYRITPATQPVLTLRTSEGDTLKFISEKTPEARYGNEGEIIFLEVAHETLPCPTPEMPDKHCLQVRRIDYDNHGLKTETGSWERLYQDIEGYEFQPGIRPILRVKRFRKTPPSSGTPEFAYVLDLVVESLIIVKPEREKEPPSAH